MANFGSFWSMLNFNHHSSRIDDLLNQPDTTLENLLDDDNIISEFKSANSKLMEYCTDERIKNLMDYILVEPPEDAERNRGYKYPFVACEILTADVQTIQSAFFGKNPNNLSKSKDDSSNDGDEVTSEDENEPQEKPKTEGENENKDPVVEESKTSSEPQEESKSETGTSTTTETVQPKEPVEDVATYFFKFLEQKELNITLVGYFCRFLNHLIIRRYSEIGEYVWTHPHVIDLMINHLKFRNLAETLARLFILENATLPSTQNFIDLRVKKIAKIAEVFKAEVNEANEEVLSSAAYIICEIINKKSSIPGGSEFENYFNSKEFLDIVFDNLFKDDVFTANLISIINALLQMYLQAKSSNRSSDGDGSTMDTVEEVITGSDDENTLYEYLASKIGDINEYLLQNSRDEQDTTFGNKQKPFGTTRLKLVETILHCVKLDVNKVSFEIGLKKIFSTLMELMTTYEWNNILHNLVEKIFSATLESDSHVLKQKLLTQANLLDFLSNSTTEILFAYPNDQKRQIRKGYLGQLTRIAQKIQKLSETDKEIREYIQNEKWKQFDEKYLKPTILVETHDLINSDKKESEESEDNLYPDDKFHGYGGRANDDNADDLEEDNIEERDDEEDSPKKEVHTNVDTLGEGTEIWSKHAMTETNQHAHSDKNLWNQTFSSFPFGLNTGDVTEMDYNKYLEFNRQLDIIDMGPHAEEKLEEKFVDNQYWGKKLDSSIKVDDLLKEFEDF